MPVCMLIPLLVEVLCTLCDSITFQLINVVLQLLALPLVGEVHFLPLSFIFFCTHFVLLRLNLG